MWHPDGNSLVTSSGDYTIRTWKIRLPDGSIQEDPPPERTMYGHHGWVTSVAYSPAADRLVSTSVDKTTIFWDAYTYKAVDRIYFDDWVE